MHYTKNEKNTLKKIKILYLYNYFEVTDLEIESRILSFTVANNIDHCDI